MPPTDKSTETTPEEVKSGLRLSNSFRFTRPWARRSSYRSPLRCTLPVGERSVSSPTSWHWSIGSTFPARKALSQARRLGSKGLRRSVELLAAADLDLRGAQAWPDELVVEVLVARLAVVARSSRS